MRYTYVAAWKVIVGVSLPAERQSTELFRSNLSNFVLTREPDPHLEIADRGAVLGTLMLKGLVGKSNEDNLYDSLKAELAKLRTARQKTIAGGTVLVFKASGNIPVSFRKPLQHENNDFIVTFDALDKDSVRRRHHAEIQAMKGALALESDSYSTFASLMDGVYLTNERDIPVYSFTIIAGNANLIVAKRLGEDTVTRIRHRYAELRNDRQFEAVRRLVSEMSNDNIEPLQAFLSGWAALEILINKTFKKYESEFYSPLLAGKGTRRKHVLERIKSHHGREI
jgi:hypothetical protein